MDRELALGEEGFARKKSCVVLRSTRFEIVHIVVDFASAVYHLWCRFRFLGIPALFNEIKYRTVFADDMCCNDVTPTPTAFPRSPRTRIKSVASSRMLILECVGVAKSLVIDMAYVIEGKKKEELPERLLGNHWLYIVSPCVTQHPMCCTSSSFPPANTCGCRALSVFSV